MDERAIVGTPLGCLRVEGTVDAVTSLCFVDEAPTTLPSAPCGAVAEAVAQLRAYFAGRLRTFDVPLAPAGTPFQLEVWHALRRIPYGVVSTYGQVAAMLGRAGAGRAVGSANGANPLPVIIPCHRVIGSDGTLTGYGGGIDRKRALLELEGVRGGSAGAGGRLLPLQRSLL